MANKKSLFLSDFTSDWIKTTTTKKIDNELNDGPKWSESVNATFEQFRFLLRDALPDLDANEWQKILKVYSGCYFPAHGVPARIASDMMDDIGECDLANVEKLNPEYAALVRKAHSFSQIEQLAILYFVQIFWLNDWKSYAEWADIFEAIKKNF